MLSEIYEKLELDEDIDPKFIRSAIHSENLWGINWKYSGIPFEESETPDIVSEVLNILGMWDLIETPYAKLSEEDAMRVEQEAGSVRRDPAFRGFDGNSESSHLSVAQFLIEDLDRFQEFKDRDLNSHIPSSVDTYRRMYQAFEPMKNDLHGEPLSADQLIEIFMERFHPDNR